VPTGPERGDNPGEGRVKHRPQNPQTAAMANLSKCISRPKGIP
jgi:hypothetical protein